MTNAHTAGADARCWVPGAESATGDFPIANLPWGVAALVIQPWLSTVRYAVDAGENTWAWSEPSRIAVAASPEPSEVARIAMRAPEGSLGWVARNASISACIQAFFSLEYATTRVTAGPSTGGSPAPLAPLGGADFLHAAASPITTASAVAMTTRVPLRIPRA